MLKNTLKRYFPRFPNYTDTQEISHLNKLCNFYPNNKNEIFSNDEDKNITIKEIKKLVSSNKYNTLISKIDSLTNIYQLQNDITNKIYFQLLLLKISALYKIREYFDVSSEYQNLILILTYNNILESDYNQYFEIYINYLNSLTVSNLYLANKLFTEIKNKEKLNEMNLFMYYYYYSINEFFCGVESFELDKTIKFRDKSGMEYLNNSLLLINTAIELQPKYTNYDFYLFNNKAIINYYINKRSNKDTNLIIKSEIDGILEGKYSKLFSDFTTSHDFINEDSIIPLMLSKLNFENGSLTNLNDIHLKFKDKDLIFELINKYEDSIIKVLLNISEILLQNSYKYVKKYGLYYLNIAKQISSIAKNLKYNNKINFLYAVYYYDIGNFSASENILYKLINLEFDNPEEDYIKILAHHILKLIKTKHNELSNDKIKEYNEKIETINREKNLQSYHKYLLNIININNN